MTSTSEKIISLMREAGKIMLDAHDVESGDNVSVKAGDANFVTVYDIRVQSFLIEQLQKLFPTAYFFSEEKENSEKGLENEYCFIIDPIDGTANFMRDYRRSSISVALISRGEAVFGAIYDPYLNEMFYAEKGKGAYLNEKAISASSRSLEVAIAAMGTSPYYKKELGEVTFSLGKELYMLGADIRRAGSGAMDLCYLALGRHDLFFEMRLSPWDFAAAQLIATEAGAIVSKADGEPLTLGAPCSVIGANPVIYPTLLELSKKYAKKIK